MKYSRYEKKLSHSRIAQIILAIKAFSLKPEIQQQQQKSDILKAGLVGAALKIRLNSN